MDLIGASGSGKPTDNDRMIACDTIRRQGADGLLARREVEEKIEQVWRSTSRMEITGIVAGSDLPAQVRADMIIQHGIGRPTVAKPPRPWWYAPTALLIGASLFGLVLYIATGGPIWFVLGLILSLVFFMIRLMRANRAATGRGKARWL